MVLAGGMACQVPWKLSVRHLVRDEFPAAAVSYPAFSPYCVFLLNVWLLVKVNIGYIKSSEQQIPR